MSGYSVISRARSGILSSTIVGCFVVAMIAGCANSKRPPGHSHGFWADLFDDREHISCRPEYRAKWEAEQARLGVQATRSNAIDVERAVSQAPPTEAFAKLPQYPSATAAD